MRVVSLAKRQGLVSRALAYWISYSAVGWLIPHVGAVLRAGWSWSNAGPCGGWLQHSSRHGDVDVLIVGVPVDGDATVEFAGPVGGD
jgi:hypothetical protein